jgi:hypothetical protein
MNRDPARPRFLVIQLMRWSGVAFVMIGLAILNGVIGLPDIAGYAILAVGLADALVVPTILSRAWKTPPS